MWFLLYALTLFMGMITITVMTTAYSIKTMPFTILCLITTLGWAYDIHLWIKRKI